MVYVITQPCCNDASCVTVCPVNCIHPTPDEPEFATAEMLYIDPDGCIDCAACVDECPVDAIFLDEELSGNQERYIQINADYFTDHDASGGLVAPAKKRALPGDKELHVAIVGAGPAAFYAAEELLKHSVIHVDMFDRLPTPMGWSEQESRRITRRPKEWRRRSPRSRPRSPSSTFSMSRSANMSIMTSSSPGTGR